MWKKWIMGDVMKNLLKNLDPQTPINLVLSGGGIRGVAHLAVLEYLEKHNFQIRAIAGSSAGALVGAMYLSGLSTDEIKKFFKNNQLFKFSWLKPLDNGLFDSFKYISYLEKIIKPSFEELSAPLYICATDMLKGKPVYFFQGKNLAEKVVASCAIPGVFSAVEIGDTIFSDGGVMDNFPIKVFAGSDLPIIGSYLNQPAETSKEKLKNIKEIVGRAYSLLSYSSEKVKFSQTTLTFAHNLTHFSALKQDRVDEIFEFAKNNLANCVK